MKNIWLIRDKTSKSTFEKSIDNSEVSENSEQRIEVPMSVRRSSERQLEILLQALKVKTFPFNLADKRVKDRLNKVLNWCIIRYKRSEFRASTVTLRSIFGNEFNPLSGYLRARLLMKEKGHHKSRSGKQNSCTWKISLPALHELYKVNNQVDFDYQINLIEFWQKQWDERVMPFIYEEVSEGRRYNDLQLMPREVRPVILKGFIEYDLSASNLTLIVQQAKLLFDINTPRIDKYLANKKVFRVALSSQFQITPKEAKELLQMLISLANFVPNDHSAPYTILGNKRLNEFMTHPFLKELRDEVIECWKIILPKDWKVGELRFRAYEKMERIVMDAITSELKGQFLLQHDGFLWLEKEPLDCCKLQETVKNNTGWDIILEGDYL